MTHLLLELEHDDETEICATDLSCAEKVLVNLGRSLKRASYNFTTITPLSHHRVRARSPLMSSSLRDVFGWNRPFGVDQFNPVIFDQLEAAGAVVRCSEGYRANVRFSSLGRQIFVHSAFPTEDPDAVFFGPDTYRFAQSVTHALEGLPRRQGMRLLDVGAGSGAGGLHATSMLEDWSPVLTLTDINTAALRFSRINAELNNIANTHSTESDLYDNICGTFDLIISNPPYLLDQSERLYRHGGGELGGALSIEIAVQGVDRLAAGGRLLLYTGSAIVGGVDALRHSISERLPSRVARFSYQEVDPDVFGEELELSPYDRADRIAAVCAIIDVI